MSVASTEAESELPNSQETASTPASQDNESFIRPALPSKKKRLNKDSAIAVLQRELERARQSEGLLREESKHRHAELMDLLKKHKEQNKELKEQNM